MNPYRIEETSNQWQVLLHKSPVVTLFTLEQAQTICEALYAAFRQGYDFGYSEGSDSTMRIMR